MLWACFRAFGESPPITLVLMGYLIGQLGGLLPIPGGIGGIEGGLIGTLIVYGLPAAATAAAVLALSRDPLLAPAPAWARSRSPRCAGARRSRAPGPLRSARPPHAAGDRLSGAAVR